MNFMEIVESHPDVPGFQTFLLILCKEDHFGLQRDSLFFSMYVTSYVTVCIEMRYAEENLGKDV